MSKKSPFYTNGIYNLLVSLRAPHTTASTDYSKACRPQYLCSMCRPTYDANSRVMYFSNRSMLAIVSLARFSACTVSRLMAMAVAAVPSPCGHQGGCNRWSDAEFTTSNCDSKQRRKDSEYTTKRRSRKSQERVCDAIATAHSRRHTRDTRIDKIIAQK